MQDINRIFERVRGKKLLVALSGGADSVALLSLLRNWGGCALAAAHFDHGIRGAQSSADADFCRGLCAEWKIEFFEERAAVPEESRRRGEGLETVARELRYAFLRWAKRAAQADYIALAHHMDDQAETVLMHLLRGAGPSGMVGMRTFSKDLFRPLLNVRKAELEAFLREAEIPWREDETNAQVCTPRNRIRLEGIPALESAYPAAVSAIARHARLMEVEDDYMRAEAERWLQEHLMRGAYGVFFRFDAPPHEAIFRRAVRGVLLHPPQAEKLDELCRLLEKRRGATQLFGAMRAERTPRGLYILREIPKTQPVELQIPGPTDLPGICRVEASPWQGDIVRKNGPVQTLDRAAIMGARLRTRREGDRIRPLGMRGEKLLSDYLTDRGIDRPLRDALPIIARGRDVLWVVGVGIADAAAVRPGAEVVRLEAVFPEMEQKPLG